MPSKSTSMSASAVGGPCGSDVATCHNSSSLAPSTTTPASLPRSIGCGGRRHNVLLRADVGLSEALRRFQDAFRIAA